MNLKKINISLKKYKKIKSLVMKKKILKKN